MLIILQQRHCARKRKSLFQSFVSSWRSHFVFCYSAVPLRQKKEPPSFVFSLLMEESLRLFITLQQPLRQKKEPPSYVFGLLIEESLRMFITLPCSSAIAPEKGTLKLPP